MTTSQQPKRFRPRFSVRTLAIVVTLVCCYAACWGPTKRRGVEDVLSLNRNRWLDSEYGLSAWPMINADVSARLPLIVREVDMPIEPGGRTIRQLAIHRYYFWFFGYVAKLPYERFETDAKPVHGSNF